MPTDACNGKTRYGSRRDARRDAAGLWPYPCKLCNGWHLTSEKPYKPHKRGAKKWIGAELPEIEDLSPT